MQAWQIQYGSSGIATGRPRLESKARCGTALASQLCRLIETLMPFPASGMQRYPRPSTYRCAPGRQAAAGVSGRPGSNWSDRTTGSRILPGGRFGEALWTSERSNPLSRSKAIVGDNAIGPSVYRMYAVHNCPRPSQQRTRVRAPPPGRGQTGTPLEEIGLVRSPDPGANFRRGSVSVARREHVRGRPVVLNQLHLSLVSPRCADSHLDIARKDQYAPTKAQWPEETALGRLAAQTQQRASENRRAKMPPPHHPAAHVQLS
jgi:hypothetical protein